MTHSESFFNFKKGELLFVLMVILKKFEKIKHLNIFCHTFVIRNLKYLITMTYLLITLGMLLIATGFLFINEALKESSI